MGIISSDRRRVKSGPEVVRLPSSTPAPSRPLVTQGSPLRSVGRDFSGILESVRNSERSRRQVHGRGQDRRRKRRRAACISATPAVHIGLDDWKSTGWLLGGRSVVVSLVCGWSPPLLPTSSPRTDRQP